MPWDSDYRETLLDERLAEEISLDDPALVSENHAMIEALDDHPFGPDGCSLCWDQEVRAGAGGVFKLIMAGPGPYEKFAAIWNYERDNDDAPWHEESYDVII